MPWVGGGPGRRGWQPSAAGPPRAPMVCTGQAVGQDQSERPGRGPRQGLTLPFGARGLLLDPTRAFPPHPTLILIWKLCGGCGLQPRGCGASPQPPPPSLGLAGIRGQTSERGSTSAHPPSRSSLAHLRGVERPDDGHGSVLPRSQIPRRQPLRCSSKLTGGPKSPAGPSTPAHVRDSGGKGGGHSLEVDPSPRDHCPPVSGQGTGPTSWP